MTKYDKSIIYKLCCKDLTIQDIYIGSTVNFRNRKYEHKKICNNDFYKDYTNYKYDFIRNNGGWDNWDMIQIKEFPCNNKRELEAEERKVFEELKPTLNTRRPFITKEEKILQKNSVYYYNNKEKISETGKIKMTCECGAVVRKTDMKRHERTIKHKNYLTTL